jgi:hypothetical protein
MKYSDLKSTIIANAKRNKKLVPCIIGKPGGGKSTLARDIVKSLGIKSEHTTEFNPSLRDPVDIMGVPDISGDHTVWKPAAEFYRLRDTDDDEPRALIIEELSDATQAMQNPLCRVILDNYAGELKLHHNLFIICTGNSTEHKSGASRMTTKLGNRLQELQFTENLDDWCAWALDEGVQPTIVQFIRFKPGLLSDFNPNRSVNPTPRSWAMADMVDPTLPKELYFQHIKGCVNEGAATEYLAFKDVADSLPDMDAVLLDPENCKIPGIDKPNVQYAFVGALAHRTSVDNIDRVCKVLKRVPPEFSVMCMNDAVKLVPAIKKTKEFVQWALSANKVLT